MQDSDQKLPEHLFEQIITMLKDEFGDDLLGILVTGSHIHGTPGPTSDLDVHVLIKSPRRRRRNIILDGLEIEMFCNPPFQIRRYFAEEENSDQHMFIFGRAIYDPLGVVAELQAEAQARWEPTAAHLARTALEHGPLAERRATLERLATHVLAPLGGIMPLEWATEWEE